MDLKILFLRIRNWAALDEPRAPELANVILPMSAVEAMEHIQRVVASLPRWRVEAVNSAEGTIHLTRTTRVFRFVDDIHLKLEAVEGGTRLLGRSASRVGLSDLGQNRRNLRKLVGALRGLAVTR